MDRLHDMRKRARPCLDDIESLRSAVAALLAERPPRVAVLAARMGCSVRTLQRRLTLQGTSFSALLDAVRREHALRDLPDRDLPLGALSARLGYGHQSSLSRAVRRWAGAAPSQVRNARGR